jgi:hypothetical protein
MVIRQFYGSSDKTTKESDNVGALILFLFLCTLNHVLIVTDDVEIQEMDKPIPIHQLQRCIQLLKRLLYQACCVDAREDKRVTMDLNYFGLSLISFASKALRDLYDCRSSRRPLCVESAQS